MALFSSRLAKLVRVTVFFSQVMLAILGCDNIYASGAAKGFRSQFGLIFARQRLRKILMQKATVGNTLDYLLAAINRVTFALSRTFIMASNSGGTDA
jgi:hypothetical protein